MFKACLLLLLLCQLSVYSELKYAPDITRGGKNIFTIYPTLNPELATYHVSAITNDLEVYIIPFAEGSNGYQTHVCMNAITVIYYGYPRGCDRNLMIETYNCNYGSAVTKKQLLNAHWQERFGPVYIAYSSHTERFDQLLFQHQLVGARFVYIVTGFLPPYCAAPTVTILDIRPPKIDVNCSTSFAGRFETDGRDAVYSLLYDTWSSGVHRLMVGKEGIYLLLFQTQWLNSSDTFLLNKMDAQNVSTFANGTVWCTFDIVPVEDLSFPLEDPVIPDQLSFYKGIYPPIYYFSRVGGFIVGRKGFGGKLLYPWLPDGVQGGGKILFQTRDIVPIDIEIKPQPEFQDYYETCDKFYPAAEFFTVNGIQFSRNSELRCYAPYPNPDIITAGTPIDVKYKECLSIGGFPAQSETMCAIDSWRTWCKMGYFYSMGKCLYKPDPTKDQKVLQSDAASFCTNLFKHNKVLTRPDEKLNTDILNRFVFFLARVPTKITKSGNLCECYEAPSVDGVLVGQKVPCSCEALGYPLCYYQMLDHHLIISDYDMHPSNFYTLKHGQKGLKYDGREFPIECPFGSGGPHCMSFYCPPPTITLNDNGTVSSPELRFYLACYATKGTCDHNQPWACTCTDLYGPPANFLNDTDPAINYVCACPKAYGAQTFPYFGYIVNNQSFDGAGEAICNYRGAGRCVGIEGFAFECESTFSRDMNPGSPTPYKVDWQGKALTCPKPKILDVEAIAFRFSEEICGGNGICGPHGEDDNEAILPGMDTSILFREEVIGKNGCACKRGGGIACTSVAPQQLPYTAKTGNAFLLQIKTKVKKVIVSSILFALKQDVCQATGVFLSNNGVDKLVNCGPSVNGTFYCPQPLNSTYWYVIVEPLTGRCKLKIFDEDFPICGYFPNKFAARFFANEEWDSYQNYRKEQPFDFARLGSTQTQCLCSPGFDGERCANGVSGITQEGVITCGQNTVPSRGKPTLDGCDCAIIGEFKLEGESCQCASIDGKMCGGLGVCREPLFPWGRCKFHVDQYEEDSLSKSLDSGVIVTQVDRLYTYSVIEDSYFVINNRIWHFFPGQLLVIDKLLSNLTVDSFPERRIGLNFSYDCPINTNSPQVVLVNLTVQEVEFVCDPSDVDILSCYVTVERVYLCDIDCGFDNVCGDNKGTLPCILAINGFQVVPNTEALVTGTYTWTYAIKAMAIPLFDIANGEISYPFGRLDCSNPVHRSIDSGLLNAGFQTVLQCSHERITPYSKANGVGFGLFDNALFQFDDFLSKKDMIPFTEEVFWYVASLVNNVKCNITGIFNKGFWDAYWVKQVQTNFQNETVINTDVTNATVVPVYYTNGTGNLRQGHYGFTYLHEEYILSYPYLNLANMTYNLQRGYFLFVPNLDYTEELRSMSVTPRFNGMTAMQVFGLSGKVCTTYQRRILANETLLFDCLDALQKESLGISLQRILSLNPSQYGPISQLLQNSTNAYVMFISMDPAYEMGTFYTSDFQTKSRSGLSYNDLWNSITYQIMQLKRFPFNQAYHDSCTQDYGGSFTDIKYPDDMEFILDFYKTSLSPARCSSDVQCKSFSSTTNEPLRDYTCVYPTSRNRRWLNGNIGFGLRGDEAGCDCSVRRGHLDSQTFCSTCKPGYGPKPLGIDATWNHLISQQLLYGSNIFFNDTLQVCTVPLFRGYPCGGTSFISFDPSPPSENITVTVFNKQFIRRCQELHVTTNNVVSTFSRVDNFDVSIHLQAFKNVGGDNSTLNVIRERIFLNGEEIELGICQDKDTCEILGMDMTIYCKETIYTRSSVQVYENNFWTSVLAF